MGTCPSELVSPPLLGRGGSALLALPAGGWEKRLVPPCPRGMAGRLGELVLCKRPHWVCPLSFRHKFLPKVSFYCSPPGFSSSMGCRLKALLTPRPPTSSAPMSFVRGRGPREEGPGAPFAPENSLEQRVAHSWSPWTLQRDLPT